MLPNWTHTNPEGEGAGAAVTSHKSIIHHRHEIVMSTHVEAAATVGNGNGDANGRWHSRARTK